ncbi:hypothetical protein CHUAL_006818 [Chamberlinius hualienensis]
MKMSSVIALMVVLVATANAVIGFDIAPKEDFSKRAVDLPFELNISSGNCLSLNTEPDDSLVVDKLWKAVKLTANSTCLYIGLRTLPNDIPGLTGTAEYTIITSEKDEIQRDRLYVQVPQSGLYLVSSQESQTEPITADSVTFVFTVLKVSYRTLLAVICPVQSTEFRSIAVIFTSVRNNPEIAEFEQYARDSGVDLTNLRELDPRCLIGN